MRVTIRGKTYKTVQLAAKALNVKPHAIYSALNHGDIDKVGTGSGGNRDNTPKPVTIAGETFPSMSALGRKLGLTQRQVQYRIKENDIDYLEKMYAKTN